MKIDNCPRCDYKNIDWIRIPYYNKLKCKKCGFELGGEDFKQVLKDWNNTKKHDK
jgi:hypothetical protein